MIFARDKLLELLQFRHHEVAQVLVGGDEELRLVRVLVHHVMGTAERHLDRFTVGVSELSLHDRLRRRILVLWLSFDLAHS